MSIFEPVTLEWHGKTYTIPADNILPLVADIESKITFMELAQAMQDQIKMPIATLSMVYGKVLRHAGAPVSDEEVYAGMFGADENKEAVSEGIMTMLRMMTPPGVMEQAEKLVDNPPQKKTSASSNRATRRSSAAKARRSNQVSSGD